MSDSDPGSPLQRAKGVRKQAEIIQEQVDETAVEFHAREIGSTAQELIDELEGQ